MADLTQETKFGPDLTGVKKNLPGPIANWHRKIKN